MGILTAQQAVALYGEENPFTSPAALRASNYCAPADGALSRLLDWRRVSSRTRFAEKAFRAFVLSSAFSCVAGKAAIASAAYRFGRYSDFGSLASSEGLARDLCAFVAERPFMSARYASFIAVFDESECGGERWFETALWRELQRLAELSARHFAWDSRCADDVEAPDFGFSFAGKAFFVVGLHPNSSRLSRRFLMPALVFNAHEQFVEARRNGRFERIQRLVRARELTLQGSVNPELSEFGRRSEARQYSGRHAESDWRCPFKAP